MIPVHTKQYAAAATNPPASTGWRCTSTATRRAVGEQLNGGHFHAPADDDADLGMIYSSAGRSARRGPRSGGAQYRRKTFLRG
jgi:hypothetical protein